MDTQKEYLSKEKFEELKSELEFLTHIRRKEIAEALEAAKALGDLSENAEYHSARELQASVEERTDQGLIKEKLRIELRRFLRKRSGRRPFVLPVIMEI